MTLFCLANLSKSGMPYDIRVPRFGNLS